MSGQTEEAILVVGTAPLAKPPVLLLRQRLVQIGLEWEARCGVAPQITSTIAEYDASQLVGCSEADYCFQMQGRTAVSKGHDFEFDGKKYQVKSNRPSGKPGSPVTLVKCPKNLDWDYLLWVLYDRVYRVQEAWLWERDVFAKTFPDYLTRRFSPKILGNPVSAKRLWSR